MKQKGFVPILIVIILAAVMLGGYLLNLITLEKSKSATSSTPPDACSNFKTYRSLTEALKEPEKVCYLDLSNNNLTELPPQVLQFNNLHSLYLNNNKLKTLPEGIKSLKQLKLIDLTGNPIRLEEVEKIRELLPNTDVGLIIPMDLPTK